ncbi:MAG: FxLYD domain-containing protein [Pyrinomonadaceae bacterium]
MKLTFKSLGVITLVGSLVVFSFASALLTTETGVDSVNFHEQEESGKKIALTETYDKVRNGARLILKFDEAANEFKGTVENTTKKTLKRVRIEVHLSNGKELGPTASADLGAGQKREVSLPATTAKFTWWTTHAEVGSGEHDREGGKEKKEKP